MKENDRCVYVREYSELPGLQKAASVRYELLGEEGIYRFHVMRQPDGKSAAFRLAGLSRDAARDLLQFLYENSVGPESAYAVARDCVQPPVMAAPDKE